jgi:gluconolactonase
MMHGNGLFRRDTLKLVRRTLRLLPIVFVSASLFSAERLQPIEVTRFRSFAESVAFDYDGSAYVAHGRFISRVTLDGKKTIWSETGAPTGHKVLPDGTHLVCDPSRHAVLHLDAQGKILGPASSGCNGKRLTAPQDLTLDPKGGFYFTDSGEAHEQNAGAIYFVDQQGRTRLAAAELNYPQGIVLRPDGKTLLIAESLRNRILSYEVLGPGRLGPMKVFADLPTKQPGQPAPQPDGLCLDQHANLYVAHYGVGAVEVFNRKGRFIRQYPAGLLTASSVAFGGAKLDQLFITGALGAEGRTLGALFRLPLPSVKGLPLPPRAQP